MSVAAIAVLNQRVLLSESGSYGDEADSEQPDPESAWLSAKEESGLAGLLDHPAAGARFGASDKEYVWWNDGGQPLGHEIQSFVAPGPWRLTQDFLALPLAPPGADSAQGRDGLAPEMSSAEPIGRKLAANQSDPLTTWLISQSPVLSQNGLIAPPQASSADSLGEGGDGMHNGGRRVVPTHPDLNPFASRLTLAHGYAGAIQVESGAGINTVTGAQDAAFELRVTERLAQTELDHECGLPNAACPGAPIPIDSIEAAVAGPSMGQLDQSESASQSDLGQLAETPAAESRQEQDQQGDPHQEQQFSRPEQGEEGRVGGLHPTPLPAAEPFGAQVGVSRTEVKATEPERPAVEAPNRTQPVPPLEETESHAPIRAVHVEMTSPTMGKVKVRIFGTPNAMQIQVKSLDWEIRQSLQSGVKELVGRVEQLGLRVEDISGHSLKNFMSPGAGSPVTPVPEFATGPAGSRTHTGHDGRHPDGSRPDWEEAIRRSQQARRRR